MRPCTAAIAFVFITALVACDSQRLPAQNMTADAPAPGAVSMKDSPSSDPSLPSASDVARPPTVAGGLDDKASRPLGTLTKKDESEAMPKAGQANTHSSPSLDAASSPAR